MKEYVLTILVFGMIVGFSLNAFAQGQTLNREITIFGGATFNDKTEATGALALAANISPRVGIEGEAGAIFADNTTFNGSLNLVFNFGSSSSALVPYLIGGGGILANGGTDVAINAGLGLKMFIAYNIAIRADFRGFFASEGGNVEDLLRLYGGLTFFF